MEIDTSLCLQKVTTEEEQGVALPNDERIDAIFDVYRDVSIKSAERMQRGSGEGVVFANIMPGHRIKQWRHLLVCASSKIKLVQFMVEDWKKPHVREK